MEYALIFGLGILVGIISRGININITRQEPDMPTEYNQSPVDMLDPEVRNYYDQRGRVE